MADVETRESYLEFINRYANRMIAEAAEARKPHPRFSERYRAADDAWRELHPDSEFGHEFRSLPKRMPTRQSLAREIAAGIREMGTATLAAAREFFTGGAR
jgi:hypothetical protein